jgi:hypothetical protein
MPQMTKISFSVLKHMLAVEAERATVNEGLLSGRPEIDILYGLWEFPVPYISQNDCTVYTNLLQHWNMALPLDFNLSLNN